MGTKWLTLVMGRPTEGYQEKASKKQKKQDTTSGP